MIGYVFYVNAAQFTNDCAHW